MLISMLSATVLADAVKGKYSERVFSCGEVTSCTDVAILDDDGRRLPIGEKGEICCRGPLVTPGYFEKASRPPMLESMDGIILGILDISTNIIFFT